MSSFPFPIYISTAAVSSTDNNNIRNIVSFSQIHDELLGTFVAIRLLSEEKEDDTLQGYLYNIDPVSFTTILLQVKFFFYFTNPFDWSETIETKILLLSFFF